MKLSLYIINEATVYIINEATIYMINEAILYINHNVTRRFNSIINTKNNIFCFFLSLFSSY